MNLFIQPATTALVPPAKPHAMNANVLSHAAIVNPLIIGAASDDHVDLPRPLHNKAKTIGELKITIIPEMPCRRFPICEIRSAGAGFVRKMPALTYATPMSTNHDRARCSSVRCKLGHNAWVRASDAAPNEKNAIDINQ